MSKLTDAFDKVEPNEEKKQEVLYKTLRHRKRLNWNMGRAVVAVSTAVVLIFCAVFIPMAINGKEPTPITNIYNGKYGEFLITEGILTKYLGSDASVVIPTFIKGIGQSAFYEADTLESVTIPNSVTSISYKAFYKCTSLAEIVIPDSIISIGEYAFAYTSITSISISKSVTSIGNWAFAGCSLLETINVDSDNPIFMSEGNCLIEREFNRIIQGCKRSIIPQSVEMIGTAAFYGSSLLENITIPDSIKYIGEGAFAYCSALKKIIIPQYVAYIGTDVFSGCTSLESISIASENLQFRSEGNCVIRITDNCLIIGIKNSVIPYGVSKISGTAFYNSAITSVEIPNSVVSIEFESFAYSALTEIIIPASVNYIHAAAFSFCYSLKTIAVAPENDYYKSEGNCLIRVADNALILAAKESIIPNHIKSIGACAFSASTLTDLEIPASVTNIEPWAFAYNSSIENIIVDSENTIYRSENNCVIKRSDNELAIGIKTSIIPNSVISIGFGAFLGNSGLVSIKIPNSVSRIDDQAFFRCTALTKIEIPDSVTSIGTAFRGCSSLNSIKLSNNLTDISMWAFMDCISLTSIEIPNSVASIGRMAFYGCISLTTVTMSRSIIDLAEVPFYGCIGLLDIYFKGSRRDWNRINTQAVQLAPSVTVHILQ